MKKTLLLLFLFISLFAKAQIFQENFNSGIPVSWTITNNGVGLGQSWSNSPTSLGNNSTIGAMVANETGTAANPIQDWLITPQVNFTGVTNPQLVFVGKTTPAGPNRNSVLKIMVSTTGVSLSDFQLVETITETYSGAPNPISANANFGLKTINLSAYANQNVYVAFVMENVGVGKTWILDDVKFFNQCLDVTNVQVTNLNLTSGMISWTDPGNAASYEVELVTGTNLPTGIPTNTTTNTYITLPLTFGVNYKAYVRAVCSGNTSNWIATSQFTPMSPGTDCTSAINVTSFPYTHSDVTSNYGDDYSGAPGNSCGITGNYLNGDDVVYSITATEAMVVNIELIPQETYSGIFVYDSCANIGVTCVAGVANSNASIRNINNLSIPAGSTYYIVISSRPQPQSINYTLNIQRVYCAAPTLNFFTGITQTSATISWTNAPGSTSTSWQMFVQNTTDGLPLTAGTVVNTSTPSITQLQNGTALTPATTYEVYVRALCPDGNYSPWAGPFSFTTKCASYNIPFTESFDSASSTELCWKSVNVNADSRYWFMNYAVTPINGDQSASINAYAAGTATNDDYLISPLLNFNGQYRLRFKYKMSSNTPQNFSVLMSQNGANEHTDFTTVVLPDAGYSNTTVKEKIVYLPNFVGTGAIAWYVSSSTVSRIFIDDVVIEPIPACPEPYDVEMVSSTSTSMIVDWEQFGSANNWDVVLVPAGTPFNGDTTGLTVYNTSTKPYQITDLPSGTLFDVYVRVHCSSSSVSTWSNLGDASTNVSNDECSGALEIPVNPDTDCVESIDGNFIGATNSNFGNVCSGTPYNDTWYQFTATATRHILSITNLQGSPTTVYSVLYSGDCSGTLSVVECDTFSTGVTTNTYENLVIGQTYYVKIYTNTATATTSYTACILTPLQPIAVNNTQYTVQQLVTEILINNPCANIQNISWRTGANNAGIGYFDKNNSAFPYQDGVILSTGSVLSAPGPKGTGIQSYSTANWGGDADLSAVLAAQNLTGSLNNATVLEFDFTAITPQMSFNFLFASEEYGQYQCSYSDVFAFLLTDLTTNVTTNIAVIPNTTIPVSVTTIHDAQFYSGGGVNCGNANVQYFGSFYNGTNAASLGAPINFKGNTVSMVAQSAVVPGTTYHIKLAIADYLDSSFDSAVFIEGGSFELGSVDLGTDLTVEENNALCAQQSYVLNSGLNLDEYNIKWYKDGVELVGQTQPDLLVTESGTYTVEATYIGSHCSISDDIIVEIYPFFIDDFAQPELIKVCSNGDQNIDLTYNEPIMLNGISPNDFQFQYYSSAYDLSQNVNEITNSTSYFVDHTQDIYVKITNLISGCEEFMTFKVEFIKLATPVVPEDEIVCTAYLLPPLPEGQNYFTGPEGTGDNLKENTYIGPGKYKIYVYSVNDICSEDGIFNVEVLECYIQKGVSPNGDGLNDYLDLEYFNASKVMIYNRYGDEVYSHGPGYTTQWHGQSNSGDELPSGTYFYSIESPFENYTGWIQLVREVK